MLEIMGKDSMDRMMDIYEMMKNVRRISFQAKSLEGSSTGWNYYG